MGLLSKTQLGRYALWRTPTWKDHLRFPAAIVASGDARPLVQARHILDARGLRVPLSGHEEVALHDLLERTGTSGLLVVKDGEVVCEWRRNGFSHHAVSRTMSVSKSVAWCLVGQAIARCELPGVEARIGDFVTGIRDPRARQLTVAALMRMASGIRFREGLAPWSDQAHTYHGLGLRERALRIPVTDPVDRWFHYNDWHPLLVALLLEQTSGRRVAQLLSEFWLAIDGGSATLSVDTDTRYGLGHLESGFNTSIAGLVRLGELVRQRGQLDGCRILPQEWMERLDDLSDAWSAPEHFAYYRAFPWGRPLASGRYAYKDFWWHYLPRPGIHDIFAMGVLGAHVYVSRDTHCVIVRQSRRFPPGIWWPPILRGIAEQVARH